MRSQGNGPERAGRRAKTRLYSDRMLWGLMAGLLAVAIGVSGFALRPMLAAPGPKDASKGKEKKQDELWDLKTLFPKKPFFGPAARSARFSPSGRYAAYLYRPYLERRHGNDLWIYDFQTDRARRVTSVSVMSRFQYQARKVRDDRIAKYRKHLKSKTKTGGSKKSSKQETNSAAAKKKEATKLTGDEVLESDADDEKAPRYSGVTSFTWHPAKDELLFVSGGDIYRWKVGDKVPSRLTMTQTAERSVAYLPDGSGFTYQGSESVFRIHFGESIVRQLSPPLPKGQSVSAYRISPDGKKLSLVARAGSTSWFGVREVDYIRYRDRFAKAAKARRTVSDDEIPKHEVFVYLYDLTKADTEEADLIQIFHGTVDGPRDIISSPQWSPDSERVTFCFFDQQTSHVEIRQAIWSEAVKAAEQSKQRSGKKATPGQSDDKKDEKEEDRKDAEEAKGKTGGSERRPVQHEAQVVYRFLHFGGPNTPSMVSPFYAHDSRHILFVSEQTGYRHVHMLDPVYQSVEPLTAGRFEVYVDGHSKDHRRLFVRTTKDHSARTHVYVIDVQKKEFQRVVPADGTYSNVAVSDDGKRVLANYVTFGRALELVRVDPAKKPVLKTVTDSHPKLVHRLVRFKPEFFSYPNRHGQTIHGWVVKPPNFKKTDRRPLLVYVYGGPLGTRKIVVDGSYSRDGFLFAHYMAQRHGYLCVVIDPRGVSGYGGLFENANYEQVGKPQVEDLVDGVKYWIEQGGVDPKRVGIHGWSFGGFQTQMCLYTAPDVFQVGIAGAGPTEWENYNAWYTSGTIGPSRPGKADLKKFSLRPLAKNLKGKLLLIHGVEDTNVLFQDTIAIYRELLKAGKETHVELFIDPTGGHGLGGDVKPLNKYRKYEEFLLRTLGKGA